ncbi:hypothetical protein ALI144C_07790 [Actinosynnema sp. ALI-1.44]|uniref:hypothetical protein n=1 Tax=Actinosynnema sp. ALI-1.44 TaxID=1933779 RepID=UPI00097C026B|nr:hypothetical protein [Actinosynnema sp. ALI-1.44]ONI87953.1 hypothetical protein ALI144C_07790 [Actinosynnema sp. ALI-1.44]
MRQRHPDLDTVVVERHESHERHLLIRHRDETGFDHGLLGAAPLGPRELLVLASPGAHQVRSLVTVLPELLRSTPDFAGQIESVWLGIGSLAADTEVAQRLAKELDVEVVAPDAGVAAMPGAALYAGHAAGGTGWHRFRPDRAAEFHGARFPLPAWESWLPAEPVERDGVVAVPAPCGLVVGDSRAGVPRRGDIAFGVPVNQRFPKIVVSGSDPVPPAAGVAALLRTMPDQPVMIVPATPQAASHIWQVELALRLGRDVVFSAGMQIGLRTGASSTVVPDTGGKQNFRPFPIVLRQPAHGGGQQVVGVAPAPAGWVRDGKCSYRAGDVVADIVPSGLVLRSVDSDAADPTAEAAPFDPDCWHLTLGTSGHVVGLPVLTAAENLLAALPPDRLAAVRVRLAGTLDKGAERALNRWPAGHEQEPATPSRPERPDTRPGGSSLSARLDGLRGPERPPAVPPVMTTSAAPVSTVSGPPDSPGPCGPRVTVRQPDRPAEVPEMGRGKPEAVSVQREAEPATPPSGGHSGAVPLPAAKALVVPGRASTAAEQARFTAAAGDAFSEALATVNAAMATWPSMRVDESPGAKADYVAVCLYLGRGDGGAYALNGALRNGQAGLLDGQVPCLMSGIRRLPTHRRAVLRQGKVNESFEHGSTPGTVLTEPGFLAASMDLDVMMPGADLDVLIWPSSARRTSELMLSRPVDEAVFVAGARFKALAVRTAVEVDEEGQEQDDGAPVAPKVAVLFRELAPGEVPSTTELDERDLAVLAKLDGVLTRRQKGELRLVEDPAAIARLTTSLVLWQDDSAGAGRTAVAS